jgi:hypothetical protein
MAKPIEHHTIILDVADESSAQYGVAFRSRFVYDTTKSSSPTRLDVWANAGRPNPYHGMKLGDVAFEGNPHRQQVITQWFLDTNRKFHADPLTAKWFDPQNNPTDDPFTILLSLESSVICSTPGMNTGFPGSGQVYAKGTRLGDGDTATLIYPDGSTREVTLHFPPHNNGHGFAKFNNSPPATPKPQGQGIQIGDGNHQVNNFS